MMTLTMPLRRASDAVNRTTIAVCAVLLALMLLISAAGVALEAGLALAARTGHAELFESGILAWLYSNTRPSLFRLLLPWFAMLSITVAFKYGEHIAISALARGLPAWARGLMRGICFACIALFAVSLVWYGAGFFEHATNLYVLSDTLQVSHRWTAASVPVAGVILCVHLVDGLELLEERGVMALEEEGVQDDGRKGVEPGEPTAEAETVAGLTEAEVGTAGGSQPRAMLEATR
jgi:TRAP-type C4-dicarboxylate transport system permease small subunit